MYLSIGAYAPSCKHVTEYDRRHFTIYAQLVTAHNQRIDWIEAAVQILDLDVEADELAAWRCYRSHMDRALWIATDGYQLLLSEAGLVAKD